MVETIRVKQESKTGFFGRNYGLNGYIYKDVLDDYFFQQLRQHVKTYIENADSRSYLTHGTTMNFGNKQTKLIAHKQNARDQNVIFDLMYEQDYYYQTKDTIKEWSDKVIRNNASPLFYKYTKIIENLEPFASEKNNWVMYRMFINHLANGKALPLHIDGNGMLHDVQSSYNVDHRDARLFNLTFYLYDHVENMGGEFWTLDGFVYKPKANSILNVNGNQIFHAVTANMNTEPRLAFTTRIAHKDDLYLPGHPNQWIYDVTTV